MKVWPSALRLTLSVYSADKTHSSFTSTSVKNGRITSSRKTERPRSGVECWTVRPGREIICEGGSRQEAGRR